jgi:hypothetical protein
MKGYLLLLGFLVPLILLSPTSFAVDTIPERQLQNGFNIRGNYHSRMCVPLNKMEVSKLPNTAALAKKITHAGGNHSELIILRDIKGRAKLSPLPPRIPRILLYLTTACSACQLQYFEGCWPNSMKAAPLLSRADVLIFAGCR